LIASLEGLKARTRAGTEVQTRGMFVIPQFVAPNSLTESSPAAAQQARSQKPFST
jgi:hypothetical protein